MINNISYILRLDIRIPVGRILPYTTLLQTGILVESKPQPTIGEFLGALPGFTRRYMNERIETIFLNGLPVDDLETIIVGAAPILAISAAMPGLAGAIFRKNGFHAPLRTTVSNDSSNEAQNSEQVMILLKFFNMIVSERGEAILHDGCLMKCNSVLRFMNYRPQLFSDALSMNCDDKTMDFVEVKNTLHKSERVFLKIQQDIASI